MQLDFAAQTCGFPLIPQSQDTIDIWIKHLDSLLGPDRKPLRKFNDRERHFVEHERALCTWDFLYFATHYVWVKNEAGEIVHFTPRVAQRIMVDVLGDFEKLLLAIYLLILKARQGGISTFFLIVQIHLYNFFAGREGVLASSTPGKTAKFSKKMRDMWLSVPWWLRPECIVDSKSFYELNENKIGTFIEIPQLHSQIVGAAGNQKTSTARGGTWQIGYASEPDEWDDPKGDIEAALLNAMHDNWLNMTVVEGTGGNPVGWWPDIYKQAKEAWIRGRGRFRPFFLPWWLFREIHPTDTWLRAHPIPKEWTPRKETMDQAARAEGFCKSNPYFHKYLGRDWKMPLEQQWWWEFHYDEAERTGTLHVFLVECASDDISCWQKPNLSAFKEPLIMKIQNNSREPKAVYAITDNQGLIAERLRPAKKDLYVEPVNPAERDAYPCEISIRVHWIQSAKPVYFTLKRLKWHGYSADSPYGNKLLVWHFPDAKCEYAQGGDSCWGRDIDRAVIEVIRLSDYHNHEAQACELADPTLTAEDLALLHLAVGSWYAGLQKVQPKIVQETATSGDVIIRLLFDWGWYNFHIREDFVQVPGTSELLRFGWESNSHTRPQALNAFTQGIKDDEIEINSIYVAGEMRDMSPTESTVTLAKALERGSHDDRVLTIGWTRFSGNIDRTYYSRQRQKAEKELEEQFDSDEVDYTKDFHRTQFTPMQKELMP